MKCFHTMQHAELSASERSRDLLQRYTLLLFRFFRFISFSPHHCFNFYCKSPSLIFSPHLLSLLFLHLTRRRGRMRSSAVFVLCVCAFASTHACKTGVCTMTRFFHWDGIYATNQTYRGSLKKGEAGEARGRRQGFVSLIMLV